MSAHLCKCRHFGQATSVTRRPDHAYHVPLAPSIFRPRDLKKLKLSRNRLRGMLRAGEVDQIARGLYRYHPVEPTELETVAAICARVPHAVVCLLSALAIHDLGTQQPSEVWIALDRKARKPRFDEIAVRVVRFSGPMMHCGIVTRKTQGVAIQITNPARTVVDCFRYRNKLGIDIALEALRDILDRKLATVDELARIAKICRIYSVMKPYMQAMLS
jgi:predicted transcriptional regulator of viral defense system